MDRKPYTHSKRPTRQRRAAFALGRNATLDSRPRHPVVSRLTPGSDAARGTSGRRRRPPCRRLAGLAAAAPPALPRGLALWNGARGGTRQSRRRRTRPARRTCTQAHANSRQSAGYQQAISRLSAGNQGSSRALKGTPGTSAAAYRCCCGVSGRFSQLERVTALGLARVWPHAKASPARPGRTCTQGQSRACTQGQSRACNQGPSRACTPGQFACTPGQRAALPARPLAARERLAPRSPAAASPPCQSRARVIRV